MAETITGVDLERLLVGTFFDEGELIISNSGKRIETIHKEPGAVNINCFVYDVVCKTSLFYKGRCEVTPGEHDYKKYMEKLTEAGQCH